MKNKPNNPFLIAGYQSPAYFCDRESETETLCSALQNGRNVTLVSPRRMGKTGLIQNVFYRIDHQEPQAACFYLDIFSTQNLAEFVALLGKTVLGKLDTLSEHLLKTLSSVFKSCRPVITMDEITGLPSVTIDFLPAKAEDTLKEIFDYLSRSKKACYIAIDEFQQILEYPEKGTEGLLRSYIQFLPNVHFIFSGSKKHLMESLFFSPKRPFYQSTQKLFLEKIPLETYSEFARKQFENAGKRLKKELFERIYTLTEGHTWYVQYLLNRLFALPVREPSEENTAALLEEILKEEEYTYQTYFQLLTGNQIQLLRAVARAHVATEINSAAFIKKYDLKGASSINAAMKALIDKEFILKQPDGYQVYDRFMAIWLRKN